MSEVGSLESAALQRKQRLAALRQAKQGGAPSLKKADDQDNSQLPKPVFRSYKPTADELEEGVLPEGRTSEVTDHVADELSKETEGVVVNELDFMNLAPRKPDWDLKRDVASKLEKLERRTQKAIAELIRDRLKEENTSLADAVGQAESLARQEDDEDDE